MKEKNVSVKQNLAGKFLRCFYLFLVIISFKFVLTSQNVWQETINSELDKEIR